MIIRQGAVIFSAVFATDRHAAKTSLVQYNNDVSDCNRTQGCIVDKSLCQIKKSAYPRYSSGEMRRIFNCSKEMHVSD